jgi:hypothetical protein
MALKEGGVMEGLVVLAGDVAAIMLRLSLYAYTVGDAGTCVVPLVLQLDVGGRMSLWYECGFI